MPEWMLTLILGLVGGGGVAGVITALATRQSGKANEIAGRFDDASELAKYIREEVERQVAPIRAELERVKNESHEMHDAVRARETQLWLWDIRNRPGPMPTLPAPILRRLGLAYLIPVDQLEDTQPMKE